MLSKQSKIGLVRTAAGLSITAVFLVASALSSQTIFSNPTTYAVGRNPHSVAIADFNNDGNPDLAVAVGVSGTVVILFGNGKGGFTPSPNAPLAAGMDPYAIVAADFNKDGKADIAVANGAGNDVTVWLGNGSGGFTQPAGSPFVVGTGPQSLAVGDFNGDGIPDLVTGIQTGSVTVLLGNGSGGFSQPLGSPVAAGLNPHAIAVADFNRDGKADLAIANQAHSYGLTILLGDGHGGFSQTTASPYAIFGASGIAAGDFNGDGKMDVALANQDVSTVTVMLGNGLGAFSPAPGGPISVGAFPYALVATDLNFDGKLDLVVANANAATITPLIGNGLGGFAAAANVNAAIGYGGLAVGDLNLDGKPDIAVADFWDGIVQVLLNTVPVKPPFGVFDTPKNGTTGLAGAFAVGGWALSTAGVANFGLWREPVGNEPAAANGLVFMVNATTIAGSRPDVAAAYPGYPNNNYGWGAQILTTGLPGATGLPRGNGTYTIHAIATDTQGLSAEIGTPVTVSVKNSASVLPFGTIDTPAQGGTASGTAYVNFGWVLTPQPNIIPIDGSSITVYIDNQPVGHPTYNFSRCDIDFLGLRNSGSTDCSKNGTSPGPVGFFTIDTTKLTNGLHTIQWGVSDSGGNVQGIGSRFFIVQN